MDEPIIPEEERPEFDPTTVSAQLKRLFEYTLTLPEQPVNIDDVAEVMDYILQDEELSNICQTPIDYESKGIQGLRKVLSNEIFEIDLCLPTSNCGWVIELLGGTMEE